jgi:hypothetical protein
LGYAPLAVPQVLWILTPPNGTPVVAKKILRDVGRLRYAAAQDVRGALSRLLFRFHLREQPY